VAVQSDNLNLGKRGWVKVQTRRIRAPLEKPMAGALKWTLRQNPENFHDELLRQSNRPATNIFSMVCLHVDHVRYAQNMGLITREGITRQRKLAFEFDSSVRVPV
jgi:hypothetical protein